MYMGFGGTYIDTGYEVTMVQAANANVPKSGSQVVKAPFGSEKLISLSEPSETHVPK